MLVVTNAQAANCSLFNYMNSLIRNELYGIDCFPTTNHSLLVSAIDAFKASRINLIMQQCELPASVLCLLDEYGSPTTVDCGVQTVLNPCYALVGLNYYCSGELFGITRVNYTLNAVPTIDTLSYKLDALTYSPYTAPISIGNNCSLTATPTLTINAPIVKVSNPSNYSHTLGQASINALQSEWNSYSILDIVTITLHSSSGNCVFKEYKYKLNFVVTGATIYINYNTLDNTHPILWCSTLKVSLDSAQALNEVSWAAYPNGFSFNSISLKSESINYPSGTVYARREVSILNCATITVDEAFIFSQEGCNSVLNCNNLDANYAAKITELQANEGTIIDLTPYLNFVGGDIEIASFSPNTTSLTGNIFNTTGASGLYIFQHVYGDCNYIDYIYIYVTQVFQVSLSGSASNVCTNGGNFILTLSFTNGTPPYLVSYTTPNGISNQQSISTNGTLVIPITQSGNVTINNITDSTPLVAATTGNLIYPVTFTPTGSSTMSVSAVTINSTSSILQWALVITKTSAIVPSDKVIIRVKNLANTILHSAIFDATSSTLQSPALDTLNWNQISPYLNNPVVSSNTAITFDKFAYAASKGTLGINLGESLIFEYEFLPVDSCILGGTTNHVIGTYKAPIFVNLAGGTFDTSVATCTSSNNYKDAYFDVRIQGAGIQNITQQANVGNWSVIANYIFQSNTCSGTGNSGANSSAFGSQTWDMTTPFNRALTSGNTHLGLGYHIESGIKMYRGVYTSAQRTNSNKQSSNISNNGGGYVSGTSFDSCLYTIGTPSSPITVSFTGVLAGLPTLQAYTKYYIADTQTTLIPRLTGITSNGLNTFDFRFVVVTGRNSDGHHPYAVINYGTTNTVSYNFARIKIQDTPSGSYTTYNFADSPITYTGSNLIVGGYANSGSGLNGIDETITKTFSIDGVYNIEVEVEAVGVSSTVFNAKNNSQLLVISY